MLGKKNRFLICLFLVPFILYGAGRLYFRLTDGFRIANISSDYCPDPRWETRAITAEEKKEINQILSQTFTYLGKGCQSYVFVSEDGEYVIKFFKYQRFRPQFYFYWLQFFPPLKNYLKEALQVKNEKRAKLFGSWKTAFDYLQEETGLVYIHLNKTADLQKQVKIADKMGFIHSLDMDQMEFLVQKKAKMLCSWLSEKISEGSVDWAKKLITDLVQMIVSEYQQGLADYDHAIMQNSGVYKGKPIHIDVGQFQRDERVENPTFYYQQLYNRTWKFRLWLKKTHPDLLNHLENELKKVMGDDFYTMEYIPKEHR